MKEMSEEIKERRCAVMHAVMRGEYRQAFGRLRRGDEFCFLGVLCDASGLGEWDDSEVPAMYDSADYRYLIDGYGGERYVLPPAVNAYYGMDADEELAFSFANDDGDSLSSLMVDFVEGFHPTGCECYFCAD